MLVGVKMKMFFPFGLSNINSLLIKRIQENIHLPHTKAIEVRFNISAFWTSNKKERIENRIRTVAENDLLKGNEEKRDTKKPT
ncbi:MAG: hypothetical protein II878_01555 [Bacteroidales bacterium]|nr:hypothetical protein [Bacteroidales bacterium]